MSLAGRQAVGVVDFHHPPVAAGPPGRGDLAVRGGADGIAGGGAEIEPRMHRRTAQERIVAYAEPGSKLDLADHRLSIRHKRERAVEALDLRAGDIDSVKLTLKGAGIGAKFYRHIRAAHA